MQLDIRWGHPIMLTDGADQNLIYVADGLDAWKGIPGVYMFARLYGDDLIPLYIGKATSIGDRAWQHFKHNTRLMNGIRNAVNGSRLFVPGAFTAKPGQSTQKCIALIERALISHALSAGYELLNIQGTKTPIHTVKFSGYLSARDITGKSIGFRA